jgi:hypothetical protein
MPDLRFQIEGVEVAALSAVPELVLKLRLTSLTDGETIHTAALRCQIQIEVTRRHYSPEDKRKLRDLFGEEHRWSQTLRNLLWTHVNLNVPPFQQTTVVPLPVPCTFDFNVAATKYFYALGDGDVPLCVQFSGTIFYSGAGEHLQVAPVPWDKEARFSLPVKLWRDMMDTYHPGVAWLCLQRDAFERLQDYKVRRGIPTWEEVIESVLRSEEELRS